ncbi:MAG: FadR/GntR family transcriptional regulator [Rhodococcus sp. (in: high G+C Gram-positive bacteria)]|uniref:FadR/GntR family transcriptional regulator n=1 Tax=Rhodococcus sp. TaxID=1831 RepID=UPI003BB56EE7
MSIRTDTRGARYGAQNRMRALQTDIMNLILERRLSPGDPLPTEAELCEQLGIGRNTLREALKVLQALGVVEIRHGFGMFVAPSNFDALADGLTFRGRLSLQGTGAEAMELVDIRQALETGLIGAAMTKMSGTDIDDLDALVARMEERAAAGEAFADIDEAFHSRLYAPLDNRVLTQLMDVFWQVYSQIHRAVGESDTPLVDIAAKHRAILDAIRSGDAGEAVSTLTDHFGGLRHRIAEL